MTVARLYLDHAATSPPRPEALAAMDRWRSSPGNAASLHAEGRAARAALEEARARVAALAGARPEEVFFTSGATEASNLAVRGAARAARGAPRRVVATRIEHPATRRACEALAAEGWEVALLAPDRRGRVGPDDARRALIAGAAVVTAIAGHNELGAVQPLAALAEAARAGGALLHLDAVQAVGVLDLADVPWDLLSIAAHKLGGPQGIGALVARGRPPLAPLLVGGEQEGGLRPGTVPVALAAGFGAAAEAALARRPAEARRLAALRDRLTRGILERRPELAPVGAWPGGPDETLPHLVALGVEGAAGEELVHALDRAGIAASSAAACLGGARSPALEAIGVPERVGVLRLSLGWSTTEDEIEAAAARIAEAVGGLLALPPFERRRGPFAARAAAAGLALTAAHWEAAEAVFSFHRERGVLPGARHLGRALGPGARLDRLFPGGLRSVADWLGLPVPPGGCRPAGV